MFISLLVGIGLAVAGVGAVAVVVIALSLSTVREKLQTYKIADSDIGILVKQKLANGNIRVIGGVFSKRPLGIFSRTERHLENFDVQKIDSSLDDLFNGAEKVKIIL